MAKAKAAKQAKKQAPAVVAEVAPVAAVKLTRRNATPVDAVLVATDKADRCRVSHTQTAWQAVLKALPATALELAKLPELADPKCKTPQAFLSYMQRRGYLKQQG